MQSIVASLDSSFCCASLELGTIQRMLTYAQELAAAEPRPAFAQEAAPAGLAASSVSAGEAP